MSLNQWSCVSELRVILKVFTDFVCVCVFLNVFGNLVLAGANKN